MKFEINGTKYELAQKDITFGEARAIEKVTGHAWQAIRTDVTLAQSVDVTQAIIWISMRRDEPSLAFSDLDAVEIDGIVWDDEPEEADVPDPLEPVETPEPESLPAGVPTELGLISEPSA